MLQAGRTKHTDEYRFGYQGQEADNKIGGLGQHLNYTFRNYDSWAIRFGAIDPLASKYPYWSPFAFSGNRVIDAVELEGAEGLDYKVAKHAALAQGHGVVAISTGASVEMYLMGSWSSGVAVDAKSNVLLFTTTAGMANPGYPLNQGRSGSIGYGGNLSTYSLPGAENVFALLGDGYSTTLASAGFGPFSVGGSAERLGNDEKPLIGGGISFGLGFYAPTLNVIKGVNPHKLLNGRTDVKTFTTGIVMRLGEYESYYQQLTQEQNDAPVRPFNWGSTIKDGIGVWLYQKTETIFEETGTKGTYEAVIQSTYYMAPIDTRVNAKSRTMTTNAPTGILFIIRDGNYISTNANEHKND